MPKARHGKGKFQPQSKKGKAIQRQSELAAAPPLTAAAQEARPAAPAPRPAVKPAAAAVRYPYIKHELRRTAVLAGIILVILVVLAQVLS